MVVGPLRIRHPQGVSTIQVEFDTFTVLDLQQEIYALTEIIPSRQELKAGYPPHSLTLIPELPLDSLGLKPGEQLIVTQRPSPKSAEDTPAPAPPAAAVTGSGGSQARGTSAAAAPAASGSGPDYVETEGGFLVHRIVPDDNSCLFSSIALIFEQSMSKAQDIRKIVANEIRKNPEQWSDVILGRSRDDYINTILRPSAWGGAIELAILAAHYCTEISSIDVETGRIDSFPPPTERDSGNRCVLIYSGIHYDAATIAPMLDVPDDFHQTIIPREGEDEADPIITAAKKLAEKLRAKRAFTNTATFALKCQKCGTGLIGEKEAREHAKQTGHVDFGEY